MKAGHRSTVRRFDSAAIEPERCIGLDPSHPALLEGRTIFPSTVVSPMASPRFLVSGHNSPKLGKEVLKGERTGWPIFQLSLEERATCPRTCEVWNGCYGDAMPFARRHDHRPAHFLPLLIAEAQTLCRANPKGLLVRLHVLGDFYSVEYVMAWAQLLADFPQLHVFGYTARKTTDSDADSAKIAKAIRLLTDAKWDRFAIRTSGTSDARSRAIVIDEDPGEPDVIVCPAQTKATEACSSCYLCWAAGARDKTIAFLRHGMKRHDGPRSPKTLSPARPPLPAPVARPEAVAPAIAPAPAKRTYTPVVGPMGDGRTLREIQTESLRSALTRMVDESGAVTASLAAIARESGIPQGSILFVIRDMEGAGEISRQKNTASGSRAPAASTYQLTKHAKPVRKLAEMPVERRPAPTRAPTDVSAKLLGDPGRPAHSPAAAPVAGPADAPIILADTVLKGPQQLRGLGLDQCKWPLDDPGEGRMDRTMFCAKPTGGLTYCAKHTARAYGRQPKPDEART